MTRRICILKKKSQKEGKNLRHEFPLQVNSGDKMADEYAVLSYCICWLLVLLAEEQELAPGECSQVVRNVQALVCKHVLCYQSLGLVSKASKHPRGSDVRLSTKCYLFSPTKPHMMLSSHSWRNCCQYILQILQLELQR